MIYTTASINETAERIAKHDKIPFKVAKKRLIKAIKSYKSGSISNVASTVLANPAAATALKIRLDAV